jgi:threonyl-tRNA synthetase
MFGDGWQNLAVIDFFKDQGEDYKVELITDLDSEKVSLYTQGSFTDLCAPE